MPIYEYVCPGVKEITEGENVGAEPKTHIFEKIVPFSEFEKEQECPDHPGVMCKPKEFATPGKFMWGKEVCHWAAGLGHRGDFV